MNESKPIDVDMSIFDTGTYYVGDYSGFWNDHAAPSIPDGPPIAPGVYRPGKPSRNPVTTEVSLPRIAFGPNQEIDYETIETLLNDPIIGGNVQTLIGQAVQDGISLRSKHPHHDGEFDPDKPPADATPDQVESAKALRYCRWFLGAMWSDLHELAGWLAMACVYRNVLVEKRFITSTDPDGFVSGPSIVVDDVIPMSWRDWWFAWNRPEKRVSGIIVPNPDGSDRQPPYLLMDEYRYIRSTWLRTSADPRATTILIRCHPYAKIKYLVAPKTIIFADVYSVPIPYLATAESAIANSIRDPETGKTGYDQAVETVAGLRAGQGGVGSAGSSLTYLESKSEGQAFPLLTDMCDKQNAYAITGETRSTIEAKNSSKADSQTGQDMRSITVNLIRAMVSRAAHLYLVWHTLKLNKGEAYADKYCPDAMTGNVDQQDFGTASHAYVELATAGIVTENQYPAILADLGKGKLPPSVRPEPVAPSGNVTTPPGTPPGSPVPPQPKPVPPSPNGSPPRDGQS